MKWKRYYKSICLIVDISFNFIVPLWLVCLCESEWVSIVRVNIEQWTYTCVLCIHVRFTCWLDWWWKWVRGESKVFKGNPISDGWIFVPFLLFTILNLSLNFATSISNSKNQLENSAMYDFLYFLNFEFKYHSAKLFVELIENLS